MPETLDILYRDERLVAINKPAGLLVHRSPIDRHETRFALQLLRDQLGQRVYPLHRLDKPTSGVLLFALDPDSARLAGTAFDRGEVEKRYLAVVRGIAAEQGEIDHAYVDKDEGGPSRPALTRFRRLATVELPLAVGRYPSSRYSLLEVQPLTGRRHQIRRHLKHISHPLIGDTSWGKGEHNRLFREHFHCSRLLLHAMELCLPHPADGGRLRLRAPLDAPFAGVIEALGWHARLAAAWPEALQGRG